MCRAGTLPSDAAARASEAAAQGCYVLALGRRLLDAKACRGRRVGAWGDPGGVRLSLRGSGPDVGAPGTPQGRQRPGSASAHAMPRFAPLFRVHMLLSRAKQHAVPSAQTPQSLRRRPPVWFGSGLHLPSQSPHRAAHAVPMPTPRTGTRRRLGASEPRRHGTRSGVFGPDLVPQRNAPRVPTGHRRPQGKRCQQGCAHVWGVRCARLRRERSVVWAEANVFWMCGEKRVPFACLAVLRIVRVCAIFVPGIWLGNAASIPGWDAGPRAGQAPPQTPHAFLRRTPAPIRQDLLRMGSTHCGIVEYPRRKPTALSVGPSVEVRKLRKHKMVVCGVTLALRRMPPAFSVRRNACRRN